MNQLVEELRSRTTWAVYFATRALPEDQQGPWYRYSASEGLIGHLQDGSTIRYNRPNHNASVTLSGITPKGLDHIDWGAPIITDKNVLETANTNIVLAAGTSFDDEVSHTFGKVRHLSEEAAVGATIALKQHFGVEEYGVSASVDAEESITASYKKNWGEDTSETDTVSRHLHVDGPANLVYQAQRRIERQQRTITAIPDMAYAVTINGTSLHWGDWSVLLNVFRGQAPESEALGGYFQDNPLSEGQYHAMFAYKPQPITFTVPYDNVVDMDIRTIKPE